MPIAKPLNPVADGFPLTPLQRPWACNRHRCRRIVDRSHRTESVKL